MLESNQFVLSHHNSKSKSSIISCLVSLLSVFFTQFALSLLPMFLPAAPFLCLLPLAVLLLVIVVGLGRLCKRITGVRTSALAYVFFSIFFIWAVYFFVVRQVISSLVDIVFNLEILVLIIGLCRIASMDPGFVTHHSPYDDQFVQSSLREVEAQGEAYEVRRRVRYCQYCQKNVAGFDHHCPAFGNCIGQRNHLLFIVLLVGFITCEASFIACASPLCRLKVPAEFQSVNEGAREVTASGNWAMGTALFCLIQILWQVVFTTWHVYCACFNIKTDEWINWKKYPEFHVNVTHDAGESHDATKFTNPYDEGTLRNLKEFLTARG